MFSSLLLGLLAAETLAAEPPCVWIDKPFLERTEKVGKQIMIADVHPVTSGLLLIPWDVELTSRGWSEPYGREVQLALPGQTNFLELRGGRVIIGMDMYPRRRDAVWAWDGIRDFKKLGEASSLDSLEALLCGVPLDALKVQYSDVRCLGDRLLAADGNKTVMVWTDGGWTSTGVRTDLNSLGGGARMLLNPVEFDRVAGDLKRFSIGTVRAPPVSKNLIVNDTLFEVGCGRRACWAVDGTGSVLFHSFDWPDAEWKTVGRVRSPSMVRVLSGDERAILYSSDCADRLFYLKSPHRNLGSRDAGSP